MRPASARVSDGSFVSIDPAIARQIAGVPQKQVAGKISTQSSRGKRSTTQPRAEPQAQGTASSSASIRQDDRPRRSSSLRRVKNSTEILRQRSQKSQHSGKEIDQAKNTREGRSFMVSNVGTGGMLYLRPANKQQQPVQASPFVFMPLTPPNSTFLPSEPEGSKVDGSAIRESVWSDSQSSENVSAPLKRSATRGARSTRRPSSAFQQGRSYSFSTVDDHHKISLESKSVTLRIVIDRSAPTRPSTSQTFALPSLSVPIPHYRLGNPHFSAQGTPALRGSALTRTSVFPPSNHAASEGEFDNLTFPVPPNPQSTSPSRTMGSLKTTQPDSSVLPSRRDGLMNGPTAETRKVVRPAIYDDLARKPDDPSVVRYSLTSGDITAATPARIVAQISSESFMDYELVSDFFLTFRSYMSTHDLLDLLLARLRWAIGRLEGDGRIVRIRTFAALRHWILNYFMDDFVVDRNLRVNFCREINSLYAEVQGRHGGGGSDLKILQDLKRCWNGRCSLYWDSPDFAVEVPPSREIGPGGILGSRDSTLGGPSVLETRLAEAPPEIIQAKKTVAGQSWFGAPPKLSKRASHHRQASVASGVSAQSMRSDQSLQPTSCSIPARITKRPHSTIERSRSPQPASIPLRRRKAPTNLALPPLTSGSMASAPSARDGKSVQQPATKAPKLMAFEASLIRGLALPPASALIEVLPPTSVQPDVSTFDLGVAEERQSTERDSRSSGQTSPAMRNIMGSIRRALSSKQAHGPQLSISTPNQVHLHGKTSALPLTIAKSNDNLRMKAGTSHVRSKLRIDLLCAAVVQSYEKALSASAVDRFASTQKEGQLSVDQNGLQCLASNVTTQSGSILIVDDTGLDPPVMSGALATSPSQGDGQHVHFGQANTADAEASTSQATYLQPTKYNAEQPNSYVYQSRTSDHHNSPLGAGLPNHENSRTSMPLQEISGDVTLPTRVSSLRPARQPASTASSTTLPRHGSILSSSGHDGNAHSIYATTATQSSPRGSADEDEAKLPTQALRRRPGGDLRKNQTVHDLVTIIPHDSLDSDLTGSSLLIMGNSAVSAQLPHTAADDHRQVSMINTHSSQNLRPSFEAVVAGFSAIPDDEDGGLEATLRKLEGVYDKDSPVIPQEIVDGSLRQASSDREKATSIEMERKLHRQHHVQEDAATLPPLPSPISNQTKGDRSTKQQLTARKAPVFGLATESETGSPESYNSIPLLERGVPERPVRFATRASDASSNLPSTKRFRRAIISPAQNETNSDEHSFEMVNETDSMKQAARPNDSSARSFYYEEDEMLSDLSSEISVDIINHSDVDHTFSPMFAAPGTALSGLELPSHPLGHSPAASFTLHRLGTPTMASDPRLQHIPMTPDPSPVQDQMRYTGLDIAGRPIQKLKAPAQESVRISSSPGHIPFILACDSVVLAQQFTVVEQAALAEVEWNDLVEMRWDDQSANIHDWAEYVCRANSNGVDLVITRFNLVVKWTLSEIVMTQDIHERARVLAKYIHVAAHCRRLHNYATMLQITIALTSIDCSRLRKTWALVPSPDRSLLKNMEGLIQPVRNFHDLRDEMESADLTEGCIPFIGLYVHDLTYNAQKPAQIATSREGEPLINFARYRTAATIIKGLLRLIDASARYEFPPVEGVLERCLWLAALSDGKIRQLSKGLEG